MPHYHRQTKITFTIGPATESEEVLEEIIREGADICRLNMAHASHEWTRGVVAKVRAACKKVNRHVALLMDIKGPEIRTGDLAEPLDLETGQLFDFVSAPNEGDLEIDGIRAVTVNYPDLAKDVKVGDTVLVDSGLVRLKVQEKIGENRLRCEVLIPGPLGNRRHINLPGVHVNLPSLTEKDQLDTDLAVELGIDFVALSFVREADDLDILRRYLSDQGSKARIIAKIEDQSAITNLDEIIAASDGLMVARGDLGIECPFEELPLLQREAVNKCIYQKKPVIVATHMLESMIQSPLPTRAEVTDISNAVFEKADSLMLSGETTVGKYPVECVRVMKRIARQVEIHAEIGYEKDVLLRSPRSKMQRSAVVLAQELTSCGIVVFTRGGYMAQVLSSLRPTGVPIYAFTDDEQLFRQLLILWGVEPFLMDFSQDLEKTIQQALNDLYVKGWADHDDWMVVVTHIIADSKIVDSLQMRRVQ